MLKKLKAMLHLSDAGMQVRISPGHTILKSCPYCECGVADIVHVTEGNVTKHAIRCPRCLMRGPWADSVEACGIAWDNFPRHLIWGKKAPDAPGWYYIKGWGSTYPDCVCVYVAEAAPEENTGTHLWWAGPIPEPNHITELCQNLPPS